MNCTICTHPNRNEIDTALVSGTSVRDIAGRWAVSKSAVGRHRDHVADTIALVQQEQQSRVLEHGGTLLDQIAAIKAEAYQIMEQSKSSPDKKTALAAMAKMLDCLNLMAKVEGKISDGTTIQLSVSPEWAQARSVILQALLPYPDARVAVANALQTMALPSAQQ